MFAGPWFDGHLDLTYIALHGRDLTRGVGDCVGTLQPATVTFSTLRDAGVTRAISTLFVRRKTAEVSGAYCFTTPDEANSSAWAQVEMHQVWQEEGHITLADAPSLKSESLPASEKSKIENRKSKMEPPLRVHLAMEGAAPIRHLDDADAFYQAGVRMVSLAWAEGTSWAGGDQSGGDLTPAGRALVARLDVLGFIHDVSHLSERAFWSLLEIARGPVVASHSNCLALLPGAKVPPRHLSDAQIRALAARPNSRIGINLFARFILPPDQLAQRRATIADLLTHLHHIEQIAGRRDILALGSDFDSGFTTELLPVDLQGPRDLQRLAEALAQVGWSRTDISGFATAWSALLP